MMKRIFIVITIMIFYHSLQAQLVNYERKIEGYDYHENELVKLLSGQLKANGAKTDSVYRVCYSFSQPDTLRELTEVLTYNSNGDIRDYYYFFEENLIYRNAFRYNKEGELVQILYYDPYGYIQAKRYYSFEGGKPVSSYTEDSEGKMFSRSFYDEKGMCTKREFYNRNTGTLGRTAYKKYQYEGGKLVKFADSVYNHNIEDTIVYTYLIARGGNAQVQLLESYNSREKQHRYLIFDYEGGLLRKQTEQNHLKEPVMHLEHYYYE